MRKMFAAGMLLAGSLLANHAARANPGDLNRCVGADGRSVYTDQPCALVGATVRAEAPKTLDGSATAPTVRVHVHDCARTLEALRDGLQAALVAGDVNKVASFYHWPGIGNSEADGILKRMQALTTRPFVSVAFARGRDAADGDEGGGATTEKSGGASGIVIAQTHSASDPTPERTYLAVTAYMGCWWVHF
ncbi:MAG TPA: hypothetical protein VGH80_09370 [Xanthomonadaceae bacterium]|jgi:hypothetical protein